MDLKKEKHISKVIFEKIGKILNISGLECYTKYLEKCFNVSLNLKTFSTSFKWEQKHVAADCM